MENVLKTRGEHGNGKGEDISKKRIEQLAPVAKSIIDIVAKSQVRVGDIGHARDNDVYKAVASEILGLMLEKNVKYVDKEFLFQLVLQPFDQLKSIVVQSLGMSFDNAINRALDKEFREVTLQDLDKLIRTPKNV